MILRVSIQKMLGKSLSALVLAGCVTMAAQVTEAKAITTPEGKMPMVHWAVLQSKPGTMSEMMGMAARNVAPLAAKETGTYALYGSLDKQNPNVMRLLEIYEDEAAYEIHVGTDGFHKYKEERKEILEKLVILPVAPIVLEQKEEGTGTNVILHLYEVKPEKLDAFKKLIAKEMRRGVKEDAGVMGLFATAELERANMIHTYELFKDDAARDVYKNSKAHQAFWKKAQQMLNSTKEIENLPGNVVLSKKSFHDKK